jgi:type VI secretion system protein ImpL
VLWWLLALLLIAIPWSLYFILSWPIWIPIVATASIVVIGVLILIIRRVRQSTSAKALERAIAQQGAQQAMNARPERRAEIQELQKQVQTGINALKQSKLGSGKRGGAAALYSLPWYVIIGPPGAGKTTALKHSGLVFPYADPNGGGGVRGVGGTRNCDWWFTNEAILLDTAGRYTTESDDRDEWISFLGMLRRFRSRQPINGILVAISVAELIDANEQQLDETAKKLRARIDEVMTQLQMIVPVYLLFTKVDLIAGFNEFFGDLRKSDRSQALGSTFKLDLPKNDPGKLFEQEFDTICKQLHARSLKRLAMERNREARERIYQFPLEFAGMRRNLMELVATTFQVNAFQGTPIFRGFYFTSGTQEGKPLDRVLGRMGAAMGIRPPETAMQRVVESKSYFLHDVFMNIVFPDGSIAARSAGELRRQAIMRVTVSLAALVLGLTFAIPGLVSFVNNRKFLRDTEDRVKATAGVTWGDGKPANEKVTLLNPVLERLQDLDHYEQDGPPFGMGWLMYQGPTIYRPTMTSYVAHLTRGFVGPCKQRLEEKLKNVKGNEYLKERELLKTYLMLSDTENLDVEWATGKFTVLWSELLRATTNINELDLRKLLSGHVRYYLTLLKNKKVSPLEPNQKLIDTTRKTLQDVPVTKRYYDLFVNSTIDERYDEAAENSRANRKFPPITIGDLFGNRPELLKAITSARYAKEKIWKEVDGPYTDKGHWKVARNIAEGAGLLEREQWVVPLGPEERGDRVPANLKRLAVDYDQLAIAQWDDWMADVQVKSPATVKEAIDLYVELVKPEYAYLRILRSVEDHTQYTDKKKKEWENEELERWGNQRVNQRASGAAGGLRFNIDLRRLGDRISTVPGVFKRTVEFGVPQSTTRDNDAPVTDTSLSKYITIIDNVRDAMRRQYDVNPNVDPRMFNDVLSDATQKAQALLEPYDDHAKQLLAPLLLTPLKIVQTRIGPGGATKVAMPGGVQFPKRK